MYYLISSLINFVTSFALALLVYFGNPRGKLNKAFTAFLISISIWAFGYSLWQFYQHVSPNGEKALFWIRFGMIGAIVIPITFTEFVIRFVNQEKRYQLIRKINIAIGLFLILSSYTPFFIEGTFSILSFPFWPVPGILLHLQLTIFAINVLLAHLLMFKQWRCSSQVSKTRVGIVFWASFIGFSGGLTNYPLWYRIPILPLGNICASVVVILVAYAILRYRLLDIKAAAFYVFLLVLVCIPLLGIPFWMDSWLDRFLGVDRAIRYQWAPLVAMALFASSGPFIYLRLINRAERKKIKARNERLKKLKKLSANMVFMTTKKPLIQAVVHQVVKIMQVTHAALYVRVPQEEEKELEGVQKQGEKEKGESKRAYQLGDHWGPGFPNISFLESLTEGASVLVDVLKQERFRKSEQALERDGIRHWADRWGLTAEEAGALEVVMLGMSVSVVIPAYEASGRLFGFLVLGAKRDGSVLEPEELSELMILANHGASAIQAAEGLAEQKRQQAELFHAAALANLGTMAGNIGHQINNRLQSLGAIAGNLSWRVRNILLKEGADPAKKEEVLKDLGRLLPKMEEEVVRAGNIAKSIRRLAKPEGLKETEFEKVVEFIQEMAVYKIKVEEIDFEVVMAKPLEKIWGDIALLAEVFLNLIDNGNDAIEERKERIQRKELPWNQPSPYRGKILLRSRKEGEWVITEVKDNGIGIKPEGMKKLFTPFWTTKGAGKGTGLGVHVLHQIVLAHKGKIEVESQYGEGAKFTIRLPVSNEAQTYGVKRT